MRMLSTAAHRQAEDDLDLPTDAHYTGVMIWTGMTTLVLCIEGHSWLKMLRSATLACQETQHRQKSKQGYVLGLAIVPSSSMEDGRLTKMNSELAAAIVSSTVR